LILWEDEKEGDLDLARVRNWGVDAPVATVEAVVVSI
jgi:hypothetical protein